LHSRTVLASSCNRHWLGDAIGAVFLVLLRSPSVYCGCAFLAVAVSGVSYMGVMVVQLAPSQYYKGMRFHGFWSLMRDKGGTWERIPAILEGVLDGCQGVTILLLLAFLRKWPTIWLGRGSCSGSASRMAQSHGQVPDPGRMHVRRLWVLLACLWLMHIVLDYTCQRDIAYATVMITCSLGFDLAANTLIWAFWHEKLLFRNRLKALQEDWLRRRDLQDFDYDKYRDDYVLCSEDLSPLSDQWSGILGIFVVVHAAAVILRVVQLFFMISWRFRLVANDYLLLSGQLIVYTSRLFILLFWSVNMNNEADDLPTFVRLRLSPGRPPDPLNLDLLVHLIRDCPISFRVLGLRPNKTEVMSLFIAVVGSIASAMLGNFLE